MKLMHFEELEKARDELSDKIVKRKATSGAGRFLVLLLLFLRCWVGVVSFCLKTIFSTESENNTQIFPTASKEIKRTFSISDTEKRNHQK